MAAPRDNRIGSVEAEKKKAAPKKRVRVKKAAPKRKPVTRYPGPIELEGDGLLNDIGDAAGAVTKPLGKWFAEQALGGQAKKRPGSSTAVRAANDPRVRGASAGAKTAFDIVQGPETRKLLQGAKYNPVFAGIEIGAMFPLARPLRGSRAAAKGARAALKEGSVEAGYKAAEKVYEGPSVVSRVPARQRALNDSVQSIAAARSRTGRAVEKGVDKARPVIGKIPFVKTPEQVWARDAERRIIHDSKVLALPGVLADRSIKSLNRAQKYALYSLGTETSPEQWLRFYADQLEEELGKVDPDKLKMAAMRAHIANFAKAQKYVTENAEGGVDILGAKGADKLQRAYGHLTSSSEAREQILSRGGYLDPDTIIARRSAPGRIARGARWTPEEEHAMNVVRQSPSRQELEDVMRQTPGVTEDYIQAQLTLVDHQSRSLAEKATKAMEAELARVERKIANILDVEEEGGVLDEPALRLLERYKEHLSQQLEAGVPYDVLYKRLAGSVRGHPQHIREWFANNAELGTNLQFSADTLGKVDAPKLHYPEQAISKRLKSKLNPKNATKGLPTNPDIFRTVNGKRVMIAGNVTPKLWVSRVLATVPDKAERDTLARWYEHFEPVFREAFGEDADKVMRGFAVSQANASPAGGLQAVLRVMAKLRKGEEITANEISVVVKGIETAVEDGVITKGVAAKLSDFIDSLVGKETRTWMGDLPEGGAPAAVDVHAIRDRGFVDKKQVARLRERFGLEQGRDFVTDSTGAATGPKYERISEWYSEISNHLNATNFDGRSDWTPAQAQALGWSVIQRVQGVEPEDLAFALERNSRSLDFEATQGAHGLGNDLTLEESQQLTREMEQAAIELAQDTPGIYVRDLTHTVDGWSGGSNAAMHLKVIGTEEDVQILRTRIAQAFDQELVQASRDVTSKNSRAAVVLHAPEFEDEAVKASFFAALHRADPRLEGYMSTTAHGEPAISIRTTNGNVSAKTMDKFKDRYRAAVEAASQETGIDVGYTAKNIELLIGGQSGTEHALSRAGSVGGRAELDDQLAARVRQQLTDTIERIRAGRGDDPGLLASDEAGGLASGGAGGVRRGRPQAIQGSRWPAGVRYVEGGNNKFLHGLLETPGLDRPEGFLEMPGAKSTLSISDRTPEPMETFTHELGHLWQIHAPKRSIETLRRHYGENYEDWVEAWMEYVLDKSPQRAVPRTVRNALDDLSDAIVKEAADNGGSFVRTGVPREVAELFDTSVWYKQLGGGALRGAEDFTGGLYTAVERGFPVSLRHPLASSRQRLQSLSGLFGGRAGIKGGFKDPTVKKHFTGRSVESGWIKIQNVGKAQYNALLKAIRMENVQVARAELLKASTPTPTAADDIAIFVNPSMKAPPELKRFWEAAQEMEQGLDVNRLSLREVDELDSGILDRIHESAFPADIDGKPSRAVAAEIMEGIREPIEGIRWVSAEAFHASDLFSAPSAFFNRTNSWGKLEAGGKLIDTTNDLMKLSLLPLNPAYAPMNLAGNLMLNLLQQGPFAVMNLPRAAFISRELGPDLATTIDYHMGRGIMHLGETEVLAQNYSATLSNWLGAVIDVVPRRAAFLHEAWAMGYRKSEDLEYLLKGGAPDDFYEIIQRANDAIIDYVRLSPFERKYLQRLLFIYPWIRGATRYTYRFPMEHPIQAMAFALAYERQQAMADEQLGKRPWYAEFNIPIGEVERFGQKYPLTLNPKQLLPFTTPVEMANVLTSWATGSDVSQAPIDLLQPFWPALVTSITGYDTFAQREVGRGPGTFLSQVSNFPLRTAIENIGKTDADLEEASSNRLYPRNHSDELLKIGLGSLAPTPYNAEKGEFYSEGKRGQTPEEKARQKFEQVKEFIPPGREQWVQETLQKKVEWAHLQDEGRKRFKTENLTPQQQAELMVELGAKYIPYLEEHEAEVKSRINAETAGPIRSEIEGDLGWNDIDELTSIANEKARADEARAEGAVVSAG